MRRSEHPREAAVRELFEELGVRVNPEALTVALESVANFECRRDHTWISELQVDAPLAIAVDNREIVAANWHPTEEALALPLMPHAREYLMARGKRYESA